MRCPTCRCPVQACALISAMHLNLCVVTLKHRPSSKPPGLCARLAPQAPTWSREPVTRWRSDTHAAPNSQSMCPTRVCTGWKSGRRSTTQSEGSLPPVATMSPAGAPAGGHVWQERATEQPLMAALRLSLQWGVWTKSWRDGRQRCSESSGSSSSCDCSAPPAGLTATVWIPQLPQMVSSGGCCRGGAAGSGTLRSLPAAVSHCGSALEGRRGGDYPLPYSGRGKQEVQGQPCSMACSAAARQPGSDLDCAAPHLQQLVALGAHQQPAVVLPCSSKRLAGWWGQGARGVKGRWKRTAAWRSPSCGSCWRFNGHKHCALELCRYVRQAGSL